MRLWSKHPEGPGRRAWLGAAGASFLVLALLGPIGSSDASCSRCHADQAAAMRSGPHEGVACYDCHLERGWWGMAEQKTREATAMYPRALFASGFRRPANVTPRSACLRCHSDVLTRISKAGGLRIRHSTCAAQGSCDVCHSMTPHASTVRWKSTPAMDDCTSCHRAANASLKCDSCHVDRREKKGPRGAWQVTHGRDWRHMHGMGDLATCVTCHEQGYCKSCHRVELPHPADFGTRHGVEAEKDAAACTVCHQRVSFCDACHGMPMPHPDGFLEGHPRLARGDSDPRCSRCHVAGDCANCHSMHVHPGGSRGMPAPKVH